MFNKKESEEIKGKLNNISNELNQLKEIHTKDKLLQESNYKTIHQALHEIKSYQSSYIDNLSKELERISALKEEFRKSVNSFQLLHNKIYDHLYTRLHEVLKEHTNDLKSTTDNYKSLSPKVIDILENLDSLGLEISKFQAISKYLKETDFTLVNHQKNLERVDREKLHLLKKIDSLQRMIGKERRNRY